MTPKIEQIPNLHFQRHSKLLYGLIGWLQPQSIVEVGAYRGYVTCHIAKAIKDFGLEQTTFVVIDNFSLHDNGGHDIHNALVHGGVNDIDVVIMAGDSKNQYLWPHRVDLALIDGDHSEEGAEADFVSAANRGAYCIVLHDTVGWWGPRNLMDRIRAGEFGEWDVLDVPFDSGLGVCIRRTEKPPTTYTQGRDVNE